ncbi:uncharacterized protein V1518DRAFT_421680 [Limtongia smithiae]|uniref:uncharacterized protein n=1 Tax=Limtongia smithiae TaxID=1125753 RepID=UPI0034CE81D9
MAPSASDAGIADLAQVAPEPISDYADAVDTPADASAPASPASAVAALPTVERIPSMTDVLNSPPEIPVSPKLTRVSTATAEALATSPSMSAAVVAAGADLATATAAAPLPPSIQDDAAATIPAPPDPASTSPAPHLPPRTLSPFEQAEQTLREAFPNIDAAVVKAVLIASGAKLDPAFNALLSMSDPTAAAPELPARPATAATTKQPSIGEAEERRQQQLLDDEAYARRLAAEINEVPGTRRRATAQQHRRPGVRPKQRPPRSNVDDGSNYYDEDEYDDDSTDWSFFDDDLPIIKENLTRGFHETRARVNEWVANFKKKIDGEDEDEDYITGNSRTTASALPRRGGAPALPRRPNTSSADIHIGRQQSYDNDPTELDGNFAHLNLVDNSTVPPPMPSRPLANTDLYTLRKSRPSALRASAIINDDDDLYAPSTISPVRATASPNRATTTSPRAAGKWEPLTTVEPTPEDKDPFFIGDSDDDATPLSTPVDEGKKTVRFASDTTTDLK